MNFGDAIAALKAGQRVARAGWNGKGMYLYLHRAYASYQPESQDGPSEVRSYEPVIVMFTAQKKHQPGWLASQADMLGSDWDIVPAPQTP